MNGSQPQYWINNKKTFYRLTHMKKNKERYSPLLDSISSLLEAARGITVWSLNSVLTAMYWEMGRRIVLFEQHGEQRASYGEEVIGRFMRELEEEDGTDKVRKEDMSEVKEPKVTQEVKEQWTLFDFQLTREEPRMYNTVACSINFNDLWYGSGGGTNR